MNDDSKCSDVDVMNSKNKWMGKLAFSIYYDLSKLGKKLFSGFKSTV